MNKELFMGGTDMIVVEGCKKLEIDAFAIARSYQLEALEIALKRNTIVFFETGAGKTLIAIMLLRSYACFIRKPSQYIAVLLVPTVVLVSQQSKVVETLTDFKVGMYYGEMGVDFWDSPTWKHEIDKNEVLVMTPQILLNALRHSFMNIRQIKVLALDECHHAIGKHPYACIMAEFYHKKHQNDSLERPRIFGMTASPIKTKASGSEERYWKTIRQLENILNSKVFTCEATQFSTWKEPKLKIYDHVGVPQLKFQRIMNDLIELTKKHEMSLDTSSVPNSERESASKKLRILQSTIVFCLSELGIWLAWKAAEVYYCEKEFSWSQEINARGEKVLRSFCLDAVKVFTECMPSDYKCSIIDNLNSSFEAGYITSRVKCLVETLLEYRQIKDLRCIVFVERIVTAISISNFLNETLQAFCGWRSEYTGGNSHKLKSQSRTEQNKIVDTFRDGMVNIIVSTSVLEEGLDVQSCNLVIRFDPSVTICSFIQSRGRARMESSDFVIMVKSGDPRAISSVRDYINGESTMRRECLHHTDVPCGEIDDEMAVNDWYRVEHTGATVTLNSSISLLYFYCARLPSDGYFKPLPRFSFNKDGGICTLYLPNSCQIRAVTVENDPKLLKQYACLEACKQLHHVGALTDNLIPDIVKEEADVEQSGVEHFSVECEKYLPLQLVGTHRVEAIRRYECYLIELQPDFEYDVKLQDVMLIVHAKLDSEIEELNLNLDASKGKVIIRVRHIGGIELSFQQVTLCKKFQITLFRVLFDHNISRLREELDRYGKTEDSMVFNYLILPSVGRHPDIAVDWKCVSSHLYLENVSLVGHISCTSQNHLNYVNTNNGPLCRCIIENSLVCTPHNGRLYCVHGILEGFDGFTHLQLKDGELVTYEEYYKKKFGIKLQNPQEKFLKAKHVFTVQNYLKRSRTQSSKEISNTTNELPPELCLVLMSPISISTFYSFSFIPSVMHWIESFLVASNLKNLHAVDCRKSVVSSSRVLEAITTKKCEENNHLESLETLGDSFLKYAASQQLFCLHQNQHEGILSIKRSKIISNVSLCKIGCTRGITGFIRDEPFDPETWNIPGSYCNPRISKKELFPSKSIYFRGSRKLKSKTVADVVEALIGAYLHEGGEIAAFSFMAWLGITVNFVNSPYTRNFVKNPESHVNVKLLQSLLNYSFRDSSLLVEALTHGSYMLPEIPGCYQRLEFLGDAVLDYLISVYLYKKHPNMSPGLLSELRAASVNNDCYARSAIKLELYKHILHCSSELQHQIVVAAHSFSESRTAPIFGWDSETTFPKALGDVVESLAGAILVDSGYNTGVVFEVMRPLLEPLVTPDTLTRHPVSELTEICQKEDYSLKFEFSCEDHTVCATVEVDVAGVLHKATGRGENKKSAKRLASGAVLESLRGKLSKQKCLKIV